MRKILLTVLVLICFTTSYASDILQLNNSMTFSGKVKKIAHCQIYFKAKGATYIIPADDISTIQFENVNDKVYTSYLKLQETGPEKCLKARTDAQNFHGKAGFHIAMGALFGPFAVLGAAVANPSPEDGKQTYQKSQNKELFNDTEYLTCYKKAAVNKNMANAALGWAAWVVLILL